jgi:tRNA dimethylallyltransferase
VTAAPARPRLVVISGATATGKTALAVDLARALDGELVGADSVQLYKRLVIGSARPTDDELAGVRHHLLGTLDLRDPYDAAKFSADADRVIAEITARGKAAIVVGGTGLYLRALVKGLATGIPADAAVRAALHARIAAGDAATLREMHAEVAAIDPEYAARIHVTDPVRIVRALEVFAVSGEPLSAHHRRHAAEGPRYEASWWCLEIGRDALRARVAPRTRAMLAGGWVDEVRAILADGYAWDLKPLRSVGYAEVVAHLRGGLPERALATEIERATMSFAKRQRTWFRGEEGVTWLTLEAAREPARWEALGRWLRG